MARASFLRSLRRSVPLRRPTASSATLVPETCAAPARARANTPIGFRPEAGNSAGGGSGNRLGTTNWVFQCLAEIANFSELRRRLGVVHAARLIEAIEGRVMGALPAVRATTTGRSSLEFRFEGDARGDVDAALAILAARLAMPVRIDGVSARCDVVLAAAAAPIECADDVRLAEELEEAATIARREQRIVIRDLSASDSMVGQLGLARDLPGAAARGEMCLHYQPKLHLRRQKVAGVEALIRWRHPERGLIFPGDFIPAAEEARVIAELTLWTLDQVVADQRRLAQAGHDLEIFVNISGQLLNDAGFVAQACDRVRSTHGRIGFEITETSVIRDPDTAIAHLREIAAIGVPIAIDDYGAGLSSLAYLKQLPARELKIDKMFVMQLTSSNRDPLIVRSTIDLAHAMEMEVTAEGVETQAALALLNVMGCDMVQGFLISRPMPFEALIEFLAEKPRLAHPSPGKGAFNQPASFWQRA
jgi:EAL domain-containing protein (putative c-di-GMP-specific phosphodiesterase class I)